MATPTGIPLLDHFATVPDPRQHARYCIHYLKSCFWHCLRPSRGRTTSSSQRCGGRSTWRSSDASAATKAASRATIRCGDVFAALDPELFKACSCPGSAACATPTPTSSPLMARPRGAATTGGRAANPLHLVSAWAARQRIVLGQQATEEKSNEITAIPLLLKHLDLVRWSRRMRWGRRPTSPGDP